MFDVGASCFLLLVASVAGVRGDDVSVLRLFRSTKARTALAVALCAVLCASWAVERYALDAIASRQAPVPPWFATLPFKYVMGIAAQPPALLALVRGATVLQSAALWVLYATLRTDAAERATVRAALAGSACVIAALALGAHAMGVEDLYLYVGSASARPSAYEPGHVPFAGEAFAINRIWGLPLFSSAYGPLWIAFSHVVVMTVHGLGAQVFGFRCAGLAGLVACTALLARLGQSPATIALVAVNPALYEIYVADGHNDVAGIALILAAAAAFRRPLVAVPLAVAAGLVKLPFCLVAAVAFCRAPATLARRAVPATAVVALTFALSYAFGGPAYFASLERAFRIYAHPISPFEWDVQFALRFFASGALVAAVVFRRFAPGAAFSFASFGQFPLQQYLGWGLPYAVVSENAAPFLAALPLLGDFLAPELDDSPFYLALRTIACIAFGTYAVAAVSRARRAARPPRGEPLAG